MQIFPNHTSSQSLHVTNRNGNSRKLAIITGASSGIGEAFAMHFAAQGYDLLITGRQRRILYHIASKISSTFGVIVFPIIADLSVKQDVEHLMASVSQLRNIEILVNNAGYGMNKRFSESIIADQLAMLDVHVNIPLRLIHIVLPGMISKKEGIIINISSLAADMPTLGNAMYSSTKSFLKVFSESLHLDVEQYGIRVQCLCPGFTHTNFHKNHNLSPYKHNPLITWMNPADVVNYSIKNLAKKKVICIPGTRNKLIKALITAAPRSLYYMLARKIEKKIEKQTQAVSPFLSTQK